MTILDKSIALIGFKSSGKTTLGKQLAAQLQCQFVDTDKLIEQFHPTMICREIFQSLGSDYFRELESKVIASLRFETPLVIATGGGCLKIASNGAALKSNAKMIYLKTSQEILKKRIWEQQTLPAYLNGNDPDKSFAEYFHEQASLYEKWADYCIVMDDIHEGEALEQLFLLLNRF